MNRTPALMSCLLSLALFGCKTGSSDVVTIPQTTGPTQTTTVPEDLPVVGLDLAGVLAYQAVEIVLFDAAGEYPELQAPLIRGRDAMVRVMIDPADDFEPRRVRAVLEVENNDGSEFYEVKQKVEGRSFRGDLESSFNFTVPGDQIGATTKFHVSLYETSNTEPVVGEELKTKWHSGSMDTVRSDTLTVVIVPVRYTYQGANLIPDTSATQIARYHDWMYAMYPVDQVDIVVAPEIVWPNRIRSNNVYDWVDLLDVIADMRADDAGQVDPNTYYYGVFNSESSFGNFCNQGCILGLSNLAWSANDPWYRSSIGIGFTGFFDVAATTMVHEVGHAHGRSHADCGGAQGIDPGYPYGPQAIIGTWGYDILKGDLYNPNDTHDMMGYCEPMWISDYQYYNIYLRIAAIGNVNRSDRIPWQTYKIGEGGVARIDRVREFVPDLVGVPVDVELLDDRGNVVDVVDGLFSPISHGYGGTVMTDLITDPRVVDARVPKLEQLAE